MPYICLLCPSNPAGWFMLSNHVLSSCHNSIFSFFSLSKGVHECMWNIMLQREMSGSVATCLCSIHLRIAFYAPRVDRGMLGKGKNIDMLKWPTNAQTDYICFSMTSSVCSMTPGVTAGYLHTKVRERLTRSDVTCSKLHHNANKDFKKPPCTLRQNVYPNGNFIQYSFFLLHLCLHFLFPFLLLSSRRCVTSARPCLMS